MSDELPDVGRHSAGDVAHSIARAAAGSIPLVGAGAAELLDWFWKAPIERRREETINLLAKALEELRTRGIDLEALQRDEAFIDSVTQAAKIASQHHQKEKREALRNAIINSGLPHAPEESKRQMFFHFIDRFTVQHVSVLELLSDPNNWFYQHGRPPPQGYGGSAEHAINLAFQELNNEPAFRDAIWNDLQQAGLADKAPPPGIVTPAKPRVWGNPGGMPGVGQAITTSPFPGKFTTSLGDEFLAFIKSTDSPSRK